MEETQEYTISADTPPAPLPAYPVLGIDIQEHHAVLVISFGPGTWISQAVTGEQMNDICHKWLSRHKKLETH
jgi:hypothetical protein